MNDMASFDDLDIGIIVVKPDRTVIRWNHWIAEQASLPVEEVLGRDLFDIFPQLAGGRLAQGIEGAITSGVTSVISHHLNPNLLPLATRFTQGVRPTRQSIVVKPLAGSGCLIQVQDISAAVEREHRLRQGRAARYQSIVDAATDAILTVDEFGRIHSANKAACVMLGCTSATLVGSAITDQLEAFREGHVSARRVDGRVIDLEVSIGAWTADSRRFFTVIMRDISVRMEMERMLRAAKEEAEVARAAAERANSAKSKFLAAATHDLRQPVQSLMLLSSAVASIHTERRARELLGHMDQALDALKGLLDSLLDISKLDAGIVMAKVEVFPLSTVLQSIDQVYRPLAAGKKLDWRILAPEVRVRSDPTLLGRMLRNLVENAIRYTETGSVVIDCVPCGEAVRIEVRDTGVGIPAESHEEIFTEFHQIGNQERDQSQGLGLGLAIVRRLSRLLGHGVEVHSELGRGSVFAVEVPLVSAAPARIPASAPLSRSKAGRFVLIIEDNAIVRLGLHSILEDWNYHVLSAGSTGEAVEHLASSDRPPDIIIADYRLRDYRTGTEAIRIIRDLFNTRIPSVMLTGENSPDCMRDAEAEDFSILHKPITPVQLLGFLQNAIVKDQ